MSKFSRLLVWLSLSSFYSLQFLLRIIPNVINNQIIDKYNINADDVGYFSGIWYAGYVIFHIPISIILDRFNVKKVITSCAAMTIIGFIPLIYSYNFTITVLGRFLIGAASSGSALASFKLLMIMFGEKKFPSMLGMMATTGLLIAALGTGPIELLISIHGWKNIMILVVYLGIITTLLCWLFIPDNLSSNNITSVQSIVSSIQSIMSTPSIFFLCFLGGLLIGPLEGFADAWSNRYLQDAYFLSTVDAAQVTIMIYLGLALGFIVLGYIFEKTKSYYAIIAISGLCMFCIFTLMILKLINMQILIKIIFLSLGFFSGYQALIISKAMAMVEEKYRTLTSAIANMIMMGCGYIFHRIVGKVINHYDNVYSACCRSDGYLYSFLIIDIAILIGTSSIIVLYLFEKKEKKKTRPLVQ